MSMLLYVLGVLAILAGLVAIGFGSPASALDFGNTLIAAGTTGAIGGLITIGLAAAVDRLQRIADLLSNPLMHEHVVHPAPSPASAPPPPPPAPKPPRIEPTRARSESTPADATPAPFEPRGPSTPPEFPPTAIPTAADEPATSLQPEQASAAEPEPAPPEPEPDVHQAEPPPPAPEPALREPELPPKSFFDAVWPEEKPGEAPPPEPAAAEPPPLPEPARPAPAPEKQRAAILKSGVVDGMGYTLYVDGSIEAELPQGTVRFASIHELRAHLEKDRG